MKRVFIAALFACICISGNEIDLEKFVDVKHETYQLADLGVSVVVPYKWSTTPSPFGDADFYMEGPRRLPSLSITKSSFPSSASLKELNLASQTVFPSPRRKISESETTIGGISAVSTKIEWTHPNPDRLLIHSTIFSLIYNNQLYTIIGSNSAVREEDAVLTSVLSSITFTPAE